MFTGIVAVTFAVVGQLHPASAYRPMVEHHHHRAAPVVIVHRAHCNFIIRTPGAPQPCLTRR